MNSILSVTICLSLLFFRADSQIINQDIQQEEYVFVINGEIINNFSNDWHSFKQSFDNGKKIGCFTK